MDVDKFGPVNQSTAQTRVTKILQIVITESLEELRRKAIKLKAFMRFDDIGRVVS